MSTSTTSSFPPLVARGFVTHIKLWIQLYPRIAKRVIRGLVLLLVIITLNSFHTIRQQRITSSTATQHQQQERNKIENDYTSTKDNDNYYLQNITNRYEILKSHIHHWCLFGGNDNCHCEDPTVGTSREDIPGWNGSHFRNIHSIQRAQEQDGRHGAAADELDVVFVGGEIFQAWAEGKFLGRSFGEKEGNQIATYFNRTFRSSSLSSSGGVSNSEGEGDIQGLALGIYTDRSTNLLWRLQHGEMPTNLHPKVWWISIGSDDLALAMCSEDVVILGILRIAEEIAFHNPDSKIVIQGLLPRSNHRDGSLQMTKEKRGSSFRYSYNNYNYNNRNNKQPPFHKNSIWSYRTNQVLDRRQNLDPGHSTTSHALKQAAQQSNQPYFDYYIWPSIIEINKELRGFCDNNTKSSQFVYFDPDPLFVIEEEEEEEDYHGNSNNDDNKDKWINKELMPNSILLSYEGHKVLMDAIKDELQNNLLN